MWRYQVERPKSSSGSGSGDGSEPSGGWGELKLAELEAEAFLLGHWKNFDELEEALCLAELEAVLHAKREEQFNQNKFLAALKGVNLDENAAENRVEKIKQRLAAKQAGVPEEVFELNSMFGFESEDEEE